MRIHRVAALIALIAMAIPAPLFSQKLNKKQKAALAQKVQFPNEKMEVPNAGKFLSPAQRACENWAWAAVVEALVATHSRALQVKQYDLGIKSGEGDKCPSFIADYDAMSKYIDGTYSMGSLQRFTVTTRFQPGAPLSLEPYMVEFTAGRPAMLIWKGHPYLWVGVVYDRLRHINGDQEFKFKELHLLDPTKPADSKERTVIFLAGKDSADDIGGVMTLTVTPAQ